MSRSQWQLWLTSLYENANIEDHVHSLGQKYLGMRPPSRFDETFKTQPHVESGHDVLVDNFLNAQCKSPTRLFGIDQLLMSA